MSSIGTLISAPVLAPISRVGRASAAAASPQCRKCTFCTGTAGDLSAGRSEWHASAAASPKPPSFISLGSHHSVRGRYFPLPLLSHIVMIMSALSIAYDHHPARRRERRGDRGRRVPDSRLGDHRGGDGGFPGDAGEPADPAGIRGGACRVLPDGRDHAALRTPSGGAATGGGEQARVRISIR